MLGVPGRQCPGPPAPPGHLLAGPGHRAAAESQLSLKQQPSRAEPQHYRPWSPWTLDELQWTVHTCKLLQGAIVIVRGVDTTHNYWRKSEFQPRRQPKVNQPSDKKPSFLLPTIYQLHLQSIQSIGATFLTVTDKAEERLRRGWERSVKFHARGVRSDPAPSTPW